jgi:hypothetical protein
MARLAAHWRAEADLLVLLWPQVVVTPATGRDTGLLVYFKNERASKAFGAVELERHGRVVVASESRLRRRRAEPASARPSLAGYRNLNVYIEP